MIVSSNPQSGLDQAEQAWFDSDAASNDAAIREIDAEAATHGLVRVKEYWLQTRRLSDGHIIRRGYCYRPELSDIVERLAAKRGTDIVGKSSAEIVREMRRGGE